MSNNVFHATYKLPLPMGSEHKLNAEEAEHIYLMLERDITVKWSKLLVDEKPRCVQMKRSIEFLNSPYPSIFLKVDLLWGFLNLIDADFGDYVHHAGMAASDPAFSRVKVGGDVAIPRDPNALGYSILRFVRVSEVWWKRI